MINSIEVLGQLFQNHSKVIHCFVEGNILFTFLIWPDKISTN